MEVILKKCKITQSIMKQTLIASQLDLVVSEVLGWCVYNKIQYIVLYRSDLKILTRYRLRSGIINHSKDNRHSITVNFGSDVERIYYSFNHAEDRNHFYSQLTTIKSTAQVKGQFFI